MIIIIQRHSFTNLLVRWGVDDATYDATFATISYDTTFATISVCLGVDDMIVMGVDDIIVIHDAT